MIKTINTTRVTKITFFALIVLAIIMGVSGFSSFASVGKVSDTSKKDSSKYDILEQNKEMYGTLLDELNEKYGMDIEFTTKEDLDLGFDIALCESAAQFEKDYMELMKAVKEIELENQRIDAEDSDSEEEWSPWVPCKTYFEEDVAE